MKPGYKKPAAPEELAKPPPAEKKVAEKATTAAGPPPELAGTPAKDATPVKEAPKALA